MHANAMGIYKEDWWNLRAIALWVDFLLRVGPFYFRQRIPLPFSARPEASLRDAGRMRQSSGLPSKWGG
jgi:hypothetical protein